MLLRVLGIFSTVPSSQRFLHMLQYGNRGSVDDDLLQQDRLVSPPDLPPVSLYRKMGELLDLVDSGAVLGRHHSFSSSTG